MTTRQELDHILAREGDLTARHLYFAAVLSNEAGRRNAPVVIVGGSAIELYTKGAYVSGDIDIVASREILARILESWGFHHKGREWYHDEWKLAVDLVRDPDGFTGSRSHIRVIVTPYGEVKLAGVEDLIVKRLASAKFWRIPTDFDHALLLLRRFRIDVDQAYLKRAASSAEVSDALDQLLRQVASEG